MQNIVQASVETTKMQRKIGFSLTVTKWMYLIMMLVKKKTLTFNFPMCSESSSYTIITVESVTAARSYHMNLINK